MGSFLVALHADHKDTAVHVNNTGLEDLHLHACLVWRSVALVEIAPTARADEVFASRISAARERNDMVDVNVTRSTKRSIPPAAAALTPTEDTPVWVSRPFKDMQKSTVKFNDKKLIWEFDDPSVLNLFPSKTYKLNTPFKSKDNPTVCLGNYIDDEGKTTPAVCVLESMNAKSCSDLTIEACNADKTIEKIPAKP
jgi:hypothetical protein